MKLKLGFGNIFTDHMFVDGLRSRSEGWHDAAHRPLSATCPSIPAATCLHYGQEVFEGMKAYRTRRRPVFSCSARRRTWPAHE